MELDDFIKEIIDKMLNEDIGFNLEQLNYEVIHYFEENFIIEKILNYLENSNILRYDKEYDAIILEIVGGYLLVRIDKNYNQLHLVYCRSFIAIPRALCLIC